MQASISLKFPYFICNVDEEYFNQVKDGDVINLFQQGNQKVIL
jgi:hypothetical protein